MSALPGVPSSSAGALDRRQQALETAATFDRPERGVRTETTLYVPARASEVRSVVILTARGLGDNLFADLAVRSWAESTQSALLLIRFVNLAGLKGTLMPAVRAEALTEALQRLAEGTGRSDLANAPLVFWGILPEPASAPTWRRSSHLVRSPSSGTTVVRVATLPA